MKPSLKVAVTSALEDMKAQNINTLNVDNLTTITDYMIIATGTSTRHIRSIAQAIIKNIKKYGYSNFDIEGTNDAEWVLLDLGDIVVHIMLSTSREFYNLDKLWIPLEAQAAITA